MREGKHLCCIDVAAKKSKAALPTEQASALDIPQAGLGMLNSMIFIVTFAFEI